MNPFWILFDEIVYRPIFNTLVLLLELFKWNLWWAVVGLTLLVKFLLLKPTLAWNNMQKWMWDIQPRLKEIQEQYKDDPERMSSESMKLLKEGGWGQMLKWCMMMLIQIPVFLGLFWVVSSFAQWKINTDSIYSFFHSFAGILTNMNPNFLWLNVLEKHNLPIAILWAILIWAQTFLTQSIAQKPGAWMMGPLAATGQPMPDMSSMMNIMNAFLIFSMSTFLYNMPIAVGIYTIVSTLFSVIQFAIQNKEILKVKWYAFTHKKAHN